MKRVCCLMNLTIFIIYLLFLLIENSKQSDLCGLKFQAGRRIVGGTDSIQNEWPWAVAILFNFNYICSGTLIDRSWILTAAHCFKNPTSLSAYKLLICAHNVSSLGFEANSVRASIQKLIIHENHITDNFDIALVKIDKRLNFSTKILSACLPSSEDNFENMTCYYAGWGLTHTNGQPTDTLRHVRLDTLSKSECSKYISNNLDHKYCSGKPQVLQDTCNGDSGGGMMCEKRDGRFHVAGIVSYGVPTSVCGNIGVNIRVDYFRSWIDRKIQENP